MVYASKTQEDYQQLAEALQLELLDPAPKSVLTPVHWRCKICGREHVKSYNKYKYVEYGCRCQSEKNLKLADYQNLSSKLGIKWVGRTLPLTANTHTTWEDIRGALFETSYAKLAYPKNVPAWVLSHIMPRAREEILAIQEEKRERIRERRAAS